MKINIDDTYYYIEEYTSTSSRDLFKCINYHQFRELLKVLLTDSQHDNFIGRDIRTFVISDKRLRSAREYMDNNTWNK